MNRRWIVAFAILGSLMVMTAMPAAIGASSDELVVASQHTTETDFNNADTLSNISVVGSGDSAYLDWKPSVFRDGFESEPADSGVPDDWEISEGSFDKQNVTTARAYEGSQSYFADAPTGENSIRPSEQPYSDKTTKDIHVAIYGKDTSNAEAGVIAGEGGQDTIRVAVHNGDLDYWNGTDWNTITTAVDDGQWVNITITDIDPSSNTYTVKWETSSDSGTATGLEMDNGMSTGFDEVQLTTYSEAQAFYDAFHIGNDVGDEAQYISQNHSVSNAEEAWTNLTLTNATATVEWQFWDGNNWVVANSTTVSTTQNLTLDVSGHSSADTWRVNVTFDNDTSSNYGGEIHDEGILFDNQGPSVDNSSADPQGGEKLDTKGVTLSIVISDPTFSTAQGDSVDVEFYHKAPEESSFSKDGTKTLTSNGTASLDLSDLVGGTHEWYVVATDSYGESVTSDTYVFTVPSELILLNESNTSQKVTGASVEVTFYANDTVITRYDSDGDGKIDLTGLPTSDKLVVVAEANGYNDRHIILDNLYQQQRIFLLNTTVSSHDIRFIVDDPTGQFPSSDTEIIIEKAITINGSTVYRVIAADESGVKGFATTLEANTRYRIKVRNDQGDVRVLGAYDSVASETVTLEPVPLGISLNETETYKASGYYQNVSGPELVFVFVDIANRTEDLTVEIYEQGNRSNDFPNESFAGPLGQVKLTEPLTQNQSQKQWVIHWTADRNGESISGSFVVGKQVRNPWMFADSWVLEATAFVLTILIGALFSQANYAAGGVVTGMVAGGFWWMGMLPTAAGGAIVVGLAVAVVIKIHRGGSV